jgi:hypothetical protein
MKRFWMQVVPIVLLLASVHSSFGKEVFVANGNAHDAKTPVRAIKSNSGNGSQRISETTGKPRGSRPDSAKGSKLVPFDVGRRMRSLAAQ